MSVVLASLAIVLFVLGFLLAFGGIFNCSDGCVSAGVGCLMLCVFCIIGLGFAEYYEHNKEVHHVERLSDKGYKLYLDGTEVDESHVDLNDYNFVIKHENKTVILKGKRRLHTGGLLNR